MKTFIKTLALILSIFLLNSKSTNAQCHIDDWTALKTLYENTNGANWFNRTGWDVQIHNRTSPPANCNLSSLFGISTENGRVTCIDLDGDHNCGWSSAQGNNLAGTIPPEIGNISNLSFLRLTNNQLTGGIPIELQNLNNLTHLHLENNQLSGSLPPEIGNFTSLLYIRLSNNGFTGNIPSQIGNLTNLDQLFLDYNGFDGSIPSSIGNLTDLTYLYLGNNPLTGSIPSSIGNLSNLLSFNISNTQISGIPAEIGSLNNLIDLGISHTQINSIPAQLENLSSLEDLWMNSIQLPQGNIPSQIFNISSLKTLTLQDNGFIGNIPPEISNLTNLEVFDVRDNSLVGEIPASFANLTQLRSLTFSSNNFVGDVLDIIVNFPNLGSFHASSNQFTGNISSSISNLTQLKEISLQNNRFSGSLPNELGELNALDLITLGENQFEGCYPNTMANYCDHIIYNTNNFMSNGNNFDATWEDFCATGAGACCTNSGCTDPTACNYNPDATCDDNSCLQNCSEDFVYPGDLNHDGIVNHQDMGLSGLYLFEIGPPRAVEHRNNDWYAHPANNWNRQHLNDEDIKHFDSNGDGAITDADHQAVEDNMGRMWSDGDEFDDPVESDYQVMLLPADQVSDDYMFLNISLERRTGGDLSVQGGHFTIDYSEITADIRYVTLGLYEDSWLGDRDEDLFYDINDVFEDRKYEVGFTKTDNSSSFGSGIIGKLIIELDNNPNQSEKTSNNNMFEISINTIGTHNGTSFTPIENQVLQIDVSSNNCQSNLNITENTPFQNTYKSSNTIVTNGFVLIGASQQVEYRANNQITLNSGFRVKKGAQFKVENQLCD